ARHLQALAPGRADDEGALVDLSQDDAEPLPPGQGQQRAGRRPEGWRAGVETILDDVAGLLAALLRLEDELAGLGHAQRALEPHAALAHGDVGAERGGEEQREQHGETTHLTPPKMACLIVAGGGCMTSANASVRIRLRPENDLWLPRRER